MTKVYKIYAPDGMHVHDTLDLGEALTSIATDAKKYGHNQERYTITIVFIRS